MASLCPAEKGFTVFCIYCTDACTGVTKLKKKHKPCEFYLKFMNKKMYSTSWEPEKNLHFFKN